MIIFVPFKITRGSNLDFRRCIGELCVESFRVVRYTDISSEISWGVLRIRQISLRDRDEK